VPGHGYRQKGVGKTNCSNCTSRNCVGIACPRWLPAILPLQKAGPYPVPRCRPKTQDCSGLPGVLTEGHRHTPVDMRLYLPKGWIDDAARCDQAEVPLDARTDLEKLVARVSHSDG
jgi:hypothetical protein